MKSAKDRKELGKVFRIGVLSTFLMTGVFAASAVFAQGAPKGFDPERVMVVPYRLPTISGEEIEIRIHFKNRYKQVVQTDFDLVLSKPNGKHTLELLTIESKKIILTFDVEDKIVKGVNVSTNDKPKAGTSQNVLTLKSRSGESLFFIFEWAGGKIRSVQVNSSRTGYSKPNE